MPDALKMTVFLILLFSATFFLMMWGGASVIGSWRKAFLITLLSYGIVAVVVSVVILGVLWTFDFNWEVTQDHA